MRYKGLAFIAFLLITLGCKKDKENEPVTTSPALNLAIDFAVGNSPLLYDSILYTNQAGNNYSINYLVFYLSQISLVKSDNSVVEIRDYLYVDAFKPSTRNILIQDLPEGCYKSITFNIGVDSLHNIQGALPVNSDNLAMEWPTVMGGGYHFMKMEGYFRDSSTTPGYAMHLGTNACLIPVQLTNDICLTKNNTVARKLTMDINEWYMNPQVFDFNIDGNYIMGNNTSMLKLAQNGSDVFSIQ